MPKTNEGKLFDMLKKYLAMKEFNVNRELEVKFGTKGFRQITRIDYENVIQKLKSSFVKLGGKIKMTHTLKDIDVG